MPDTSLNNEQVKEQEKELVQYKNADRSKQTKIISKGEDLATMS